MYRKEKRKKICTIAFSLKNIFQLAGNVDDVNSKFKWALGGCRRCNARISWKKLPPMSVIYILHVSAYILVNDDFFMASLCLQEFF